MKPPYAIGSVPSLSGHAIAYRWRSLPRVRRHRASKPQGSSERVLPWQITMDQLIFASLGERHRVSSEFYHVTQMRTDGVHGRESAHTGPVVLKIVRVGHTYSKSMDQPGKLANPAHGQLNRENYISLFAFAPKDLI